MTELKQLRVENLHPHPGNPRKELGDLTELTDSIRVNGVLQNLTVVPAREVLPVWEKLPEEMRESAYVVIIGHRRLAAAKCAGLETVPCSIVSMTPVEQAQTMLVENIQRSNLTVPEQAWGIQTVIDMGETVDSVVTHELFSVKERAHGE